MANKVFSTALNMCSDSGKGTKDDGILLWKSWVWEVLGEGNLQRAWTTITSIPGGMPEDSPLECPSGSFVDLIKRSPTALLKTRKVSAAKANGETKVLTQVSILSSALRRPCPLPPHLVLSTTPICSLFLAISPKIVQSMKALTFTEKYQTCFLIRHRKPASHSSFSIKPKLVCSITTPLARISFVPPF